MNPPESNNDSKWYISSPKTKTSIRTLPLSDDLIEDLKLNQNKNLIKNLMKIGLYLEIVFQYLLIK